MQKNTIEVTTIIVYGSCPAHPHPYLLPRPACCYTHSTTCIISVTISSIAQCQIPVFLYYIYTEKTTVSRKKVYLEHICSVHRTSKSAIRGVVVTSNVGDGEGELDRLTAGVRPCAGCIRCEGHWVSCSCNNKMFDNNKI